MLSLPATLVLLAVALDAGRDACIILGARLEHLSLQIAKAVGA